MKHLALTAAIPMDPSICFTKDKSPQTPEEIADMCKVPYRETIGLLNYCAVRATSDGLEGFTDADGSSQEHQHAISGYVFLLRMNY